MKKVIVFHAVSFFRLYFSGRTTCNGIIVDNCVIKGYHSYKIAPPIQTVELQLKPEYRNYHDRDAVLVWMPRKEAIQKEILMQTTRQGFKIVQLVSPCPCIIGHVPRGLATSFRTLMDQGKTISAIATGTPRQSFPPWPLPLEKGVGQWFPAGI